MLRLVNRKYICEVVCVNRKGELLCIGGVEGLVEFVSLEIWCVAAVYSSGNDTEGAALVVH
uniref:Uncharacterized protein n=1 Tax=Anguilla anguilla TaxID=7936 RepID=A0A0E9UXX1_ANGAN